MLGSEVRQIVPNEVINLARKSASEEEIASAVADLAKAIRHLGDQIRTLETHTVAAVMRDLSETLGKRTI